MRVTLLTILWLLPLWVIVLSYVCFRFLPLRKERLWLYAAAFVVILGFDLFRLSFACDAIDTVVRYAVLFMLAEFFWLFSLLRSRRVFGVVAVLCGLICVGAHRQWIVATPLRVSLLCTTSVAGTCDKGRIKYLVKESRSPDPSRPHRTFGLTKRLCHSPFEKFIGSYTTQEGYHDAVFSCNWQTTPDGVRLDLVGDETLLWTLGEGF